MEAQAATATARRYWLIVLLLALLSALPVLAVRSANG